MVNFNGKICAESSILLDANNRGFYYGDALFETIKVVHNKVIFLEDHYFRMMASMRILRMEIPMNFTMEFLENQILKTVKENDFGSSTVRVKVSVFRASDGLYLPRTNDIGYLITVKALDSDFYIINDNQYFVDLFKDHFILSGLLSTLKTNNRIINTIGSIYAKENGFNNCLLLNEKKHVVEALNGNLFLVKGSTIKTPSLQSGCIKGVMRKQIIDITSALPEYELIEGDISPFELQKADELFITNVISGIIPISKYRKKAYSKQVAKDILGKLNAKIRLG